MSLNKNTPVLYVHDAGDYTCEICIFDEEGDERKEKIHFAVSCAGDSGNVYMNIIIRFIVVNCCDYDLCRNRTHGDVTAGPRYTVALVPVCLPSSFES